jgi:DNA-binding ferritin-like protein
MNTFISLLLASRTQAHVFHWQTQSFSVHKTLNEYYDSIIDLIDEVVEGYQGKYDILKNFMTPANIIESEDTKIMIDYFESLVKLVEEERSNIVQDTFIQNQVDEIVQLLYTTIYKLKNLQ